MEYNELREWLPYNKNSQPRVCPKCKSPYWDKPKERLRRKSGTTYSA